MSNKHEATALHGLKKLRGDSEWNAFAVQSVFSEALVGLGIESLLHFIFGMHLIGGT